MLAALRKRKLVAQRFVHGPKASALADDIYRKTQWFTVHKGAKFTTSTKKQETDLTAEMLARSVFLVKIALVIVTEIEL